MRNIYRNLGGAPRVEGGMTYAQRQQLLEDEDAMAREREAGQRRLLDEQERRRQARERAQRQMEEQAEADRLAEIERLEREGADIAQDLTEVVDADESAAQNMWSALSMGTGFVDSGTEEADQQEDYPT